MDGQLVKLNKWTRRIGVSLLVAAASTFSVAGPATAEEKPRKSEAEYVLALEAGLRGATVAEIDALSTSDIALLNKYSQVSEVVTESFVAKAPIIDGGYSTMATGCWTATSTYTGRNLLGADLYKSWTTGRWCSSGTSVYSPSVAGSGQQTFWIGWSTQGLAQKQAGVVSNQARMFAQYKFQYQLGTPYPTQYTQPCTRVIGYASGGVGRDLVCSIY